MPQWSPRLDWEHLQNWLPGVLGGSAAILLVVIAANFPTQPNSKPAELPASQSAAGATKGQPEAQSPTKPAPPQISPVAGSGAKAQSPAQPTSPAPATKTVDVPTSAPARDHTMSKAEAVVPPVPVQSSASPDKEPQKTVANAAGPQGDAGAGRQVFKKCQACHSLEPGKTILGPSLAGIVGRKSGAEPGFSYSPAMKQASLTWDAATLEAYLTDPQKVVPGNRMPFPGLRTDRDRKDVVAFLAASASPAAAPSAAKTASAPTASAPQAKSDTAAAYITDAKFTLRTGIAEGKMVFLGVGGSIDGKANPVLMAAEGQIVELTLINGEGTEHDIVFPDQDAKSPRVNGKGASTTIVFRAAKSGDFIYFCSVPGHRLAGMQGQFLVTPRWRRRRSSKPTFPANRRIFLRRSESEIQRPSGSIYSPSNKKAGSRKPRHSAIGHSMVKYPDRSFASVLVTPWTFI